jgi:hypothetical protein
MQRRANLIVGSPLFSLEPQGPMQLPQSWSSTVWLVAPSLDPHAVETSIHLGIANIWTVFQSVDALHWLSWRGQVPAAG